MDVDKDKLMELVTRAMSAAHDEGHAHQVLLDAKAEHDEAYEEASEAFANIQAFIGVDKPTVQ